MNTIHQQLDKKLEAILYSKTGLKVRSFLWKVHSTYLNIRHPHTKHAYVKQPLLGVCLVKTPRK